MRILQIEKQRFDQLMGKQYSYKQLVEAGSLLGLELQKEHNKNLQTYIFKSINDRSDLLTEISLVRMFRIFLQQIQTPELKLNSAEIQIIVYQSVKKIRPYIMGAVLRNLKFDQRVYKSFILAKQKLNSQFCRKQLSIGTHDLDTFKGPIKYVARKINQFSFIPQNIIGLQKELLQNGKHKQYLNQIRENQNYALILDGKDTVLSIPLIIGSDYSKISLKTKNILIEVTGKNQSNAVNCLNDLIWSLSQYCANPFQIQPVRIIRYNSTYTPQLLDKKQYILKHQKTEKIERQILDIDLSNQNVEKVLNKDQTRCETILQKIQIKQCQNIAQIFKRLIDIQHEIKTEEILSVQQRLNIFNAFSFTSQVNTHVRFVTNHTHRYINQEIPKIIRLSNKKLHFNNDKEYLIQLNKFIVQNMLKYVMIWKLKKFHFFDYDMCTLSPQFIIKQISHISFDNLIELILSKTKIKNIQFLSHLNIRKIQNLNIENNQISNFKSLRKTNFSLLEKLSIQQNSLFQLYDDQCYLPDFQYFTRMKLKKIKRIQINNTYPEQQPTQIIQYNQSSLMSSYYMKLQYKNNKIQQK